MQVFLSAVRLIISVVLVAAAVGKLRDIPRFEQSVKSFGFSGWVASVISSAVPIVELIVAVGLLIPKVSPIFAMFAAALFGSFSVVLASALTSGRKADCGCFGSSTGSRPVSHWTLGRALLLMVAAVGVATGSDRGIAPVVAAVKSDAMTVSVVILGALLLATVTALIVLLRRYERSLARLQHLELIGVDPSDGPATTEAMEESHPQVGSRAPALPLENVLGERIPSALAPTNRLVVFLSSGCKKCRAIYPMIGSLPPSARSKVVTVGSGDFDTIRAAAVESNIAEIVVADEGGSLLSAFGLIGTPVAVAISPDGLVVSSAAYGVDAIGAALDALRAAERIPLELARQFPN